MLGQQVQKSFSLNVVFNLLFSQNIVFYRKIQNYKNRQPGTDKALLALLKLKGELNKSFTEQALNFLL